MPADPAGARSARAVVTAGGPAWREALELLLAYGAEPAATARSWSHGVDAVSFAAGTHDRAVFHLLLERGANPTGALAAAVWSGDYDLAGSALAHGADPGRAVNNGKPLLNDLIRRRRVEASSGWTAVHQAASRGNRACCAPSSMPAAIPRTGIAQAPPRAIWRAAGESPPCSGGTRGTTSSSRCP
jgi:hypothetical protein